MNSLNDDDLLSAVQARPALYDKTHRDHCNREISKKLWTEIAQETGVDSLICKTRWNSMRDYFLRKYREGARPGQPLASGKRLWPYFEMLSFLMPHVNTSIREHETSRESTEEYDGLVLNGLLSQKDSDYSMGKYELEETNDTCNLHSPPIVFAKQEPLSRSPSPARSESELTHTAAITPTVRPSSSTPCSRSTKKRKVVPYSGHKSYKTVRNCENSHEHFFRSIMPMLERFSDVDTLMFRSEVNALVLKCLHKQEDLPVITSAVSQAGDAPDCYSVYLQPEESPE
ncbi:hypothetical protein EGW08_002429 [Elysia chlorotica]|uniref:MADF domain-containing protein n=1 Tax=Elysia chlorotica TaxID=188477 RepID=A0A433U7N5_ELYCH|nr:hypothetical protein EGW08_002429 [Elysia chlorotica]